MEIEKRKIRRCGKIKGDFINPNGYSLLLFSPISNRNPFLQTRNV
jgi:hypothetical protein